jgi:hypothetical protein
MVFAPHAAYWKRAARKIVFMDRFRSTMNPISNTVERYKELPKKEKTIVAASFGVAAACILAAIAIGIWLGVRRNAKLSKMPPSPTLCNTSETTVSLYLFTHTSSGRGFASTETSVTGAVLRNAGAPAVIGCKTSGPGRTPLYRFKKSDGTAYDYKWTITNDTAISGYTLDNDEKPVCYLYTGPFVEGARLEPVYYAESAQGDCSILTHDKEPVITSDPGREYVVKATLGYSQ